MSRCVCALVISMFLLTVAGCGGGGGDSERVEPGSPTQPTGLSARVASSSSIELSWNAAPDGEQVTGYNVYRNGTLIVSVASNGYTDTGLTANTLYSYTVASFNADNDISAFSDAVLATTALPSADLSQPTGLGVNVISSSSVELSWNAAPDGEQVTGYNVYRNGTLIDTVASNEYTDSGLFAETQFSYAVSSVRGGNVSTPSASAVATTQAFSIDDVAVGGSDVNYTNVEITADGRYMVWLEQATDDSWTGSVWHCEINPDTGALNPPDCKGYNAFDAMFWSRANPGRDAQGVFYVGANRAGELIMVRPTGAATATQEKLSTVASDLRRAIYPADVPERDNSFVFWIENDKVAGSGLDPRNDSFQLQYIDLAAPENIIVIDTQPQPVRGFPPMDIGFVRWFRGKASLTYGFFGDAECGDAGNRTCVQVNEFDVSASNPAPVAVTSDPYSKVDSFPFSFQDEDFLLSGIDGKAISNVYRRQAGETEFSVAETIYYDDNQGELIDPALAQSHERIEFDEALYTAYQVNERGDGFFETAFANTGEIWLSTVLDPSQRQWRISENESEYQAKSEAEPFVGNSKVWVFYSALKVGDDISTSVWQLRRAATPIGKRR